MCWSAASASPWRRIRTLPSSPVEVDADAVRHLLRAGLEIEAHRVDDFLDEFGDVSCRHKCVLRTASVPGAYLVQVGPGANQIVREVLLADRPERADKPVDHQTARERQRHTVNMSGMNIMTFCCAGSAVLGVIFVCQNIVTPITTGVM